jgi:GH25 family lysozyme M1 (1,4-beta-N-acetylmuramidase)
MTTSQDDIVKRLRRTGALVPTTIADEAADEIERLRAENHDATDKAEWLRRQLHAAVLIITHHNDDPDAMEGVYAQLIKEAE